MKKTNVLIFPAGAENAIEIYEALHEHIDIQVYGASGKSDHTEFIYPKEQYIIDDFYITQPDFITKFNKLINHWNIDVVIPTHDTIALYLADHKAEIKAKLLTSTVETALICREKKRTIALFEDCDFCPIVYDSKNPPAPENFPVFAKPNVGEGGKGTRCIETVFEELPLDDTKMIVCEYLPGEECSIDCFTDRNGNLLFCGCRTRERIFSGIAVRSRTIETTTEIKAIADTINSRLQLFGAWFFQVRRDKYGKWKLLEVSCRQAGTMTLYRHKGINFPLMGIYQLNGIDVMPMEMSGEWIIDRCFKARYTLPYEYSTVYVDLDDTLIISKSVNSRMMQFLYQCVNKKKKLILITRHPLIPLETLKRYKIYSGLFDKIIHITFEQKKTDFMEPENAIFIDNSFLERKLVFESLGMPVFDVDAVDCLID